MTEKNILGGKLKLFNVKLSLINIKTIINILEIEKLRVDIEVGFSEQDRIHALMYLESILERLNNGKPAVL